MQSEEYANIKRLYENGKTIRDIAREYNMSYSKVRRILLASGTQFRGKVPDDLKSKVIELAKGGVSANKISKELRLNPNTVLRILKKSALSRPRKKLKKEEIERIKEMYLNGYSIYRIAKEFNISTNLVVYHLKKTNAYK
ncbi:CRISPR DNA repeat-binding protein Cbp1, partial [Acidianus sp. RZ1]|uniref:CRISPR DNA repeat-binding protein Cbp1 n=1 Tax=Acidianus sp. RZ1 TaxID=1540082 RepID=UPI0014930ABA